jgi:prepilin peptidase CpaA
MNLIVGAPLWLIVILMLALAAAAVEDAVRLRISNLTCAIVFACALLAMGFHGFSWTLWQNAVVCIAILAVGTAAFSAGWLGGGDIKLLSAIGLWMDLRAAAGLLAAVFIVGGLVALIYMAARRMAGSNRDKSDRRIPYGLAIVAGAVFIFATQISSRHANPFIEHLRAQRAAER